MHKHKFTILFVTFALLAGIVVGVVSVQAQGGSNVSYAPLPAGASYQPNTEELGLSALYERVTASVVNVSVATRSGSGTGSGFVIDMEGHIVTNNHVVAGATYIEVTFVDGTLLNAEVVGTDPDSDLAVIKVNPAEANLVPVTFADSDQAFIGQQVLAIGSPFGQDFTLTTGIVSALDRSLRNEDLFSIPGLIQTDAAINPGNSGGPLLDLDGHVVGVNTAILSESRSSSGVGFSIPSNTVRRVVPFLINEGQYLHSWLGISGLDVEPAILDAMNIDSGLDGVLVSNVAENGPAGLAGLQGATGVLNTPLRQLSVNGDIITAIDGEPISGMGALITYLDTNTMPGDTIMLKVWRGGALLDVSVTLAERPE